MNVITRPTMTVEEFLAWEQDQEWRHEFDGESIIEMNGESRQHNRLAWRLALILQVQVDLSKFEIITSGVQFRVGNTVRYPDLIVAPVADDAAFVADPVFLLEVISPSSGRQDTVVKPAQYIQCPSLRHYLVLRQREMAGVVWERDGERWTQTPLAGPCVVSFAAIGATVQLADLYGAGPLVPR